MSTITLCHKLISCRLENAVLFKKNYPKVAVFDNDFVTLVMPGKIVSVKSVMSQALELECPTHLKQATIRVLKPYGNNHFMILFEECLLDAWNAYPNLTFTSCDSASTFLFPTTKLNETRDIFGAESDVVRNQIIFGHFEYIKDGDLSPVVSIYKVNQDFSCTITQNLILNDYGRCAGSCLDGHFTRMMDSKYIMIWGDLTNQSYFHTLEVKLNSDPLVENIEYKLESACKVDLVNTFKFKYLRDIFFGTVDMMFTCKVALISGKRLIAVLYNAQAVAKVVYGHHNNCVSGKVQNEIFSCIVDMPFDVVRKSSNPFHTKIIEIKHTGSNQDPFILLCLVRSLIGFSVDGKQQDRTVDFLLGIKTLSSSSIETTLAAAGTTSLAELLGCDNKLLDMYVHEHNTDYMCEECSTIDTHHCRIVRWKHCA